ncbi:MAG: MBL fold metallo-hydrolase [Candidatus Altiarchaeota archaeon]
MIRILESSSFESNAYVVVGEKVAVVDPGVSGERVLSFLDAEGLCLDYVVNTHCHFDHAGANKKVLDETGARLCAHGLDAPALEGGGKEVLAALFGRDFEKVKVDVLLSEGSIIDLGSAKLRVLHTPGHTQGSICLLDESEGVLFSGDTVFADGVGRTDFPGGDADALSASLDVLCELVGEGSVKKFYPGHGGLGEGADILKSKKLFF